MKKTIISLFSFAAIFLLNFFMVACGGDSRQAKCSVNVFIPSTQYTDVKLVDTNGKVIDSTLTVKNDSIRFSRTDSLSMPYVVQLQLLNPADSIDFINFPIVIEGGVVRLDLTDRISLSGTKNNEQLFKFLKAKNSFFAKYDREGNPEHDIQKMRKDYSKFYADQILLNKGTVVGEYLLKAYGSHLTKEDYERVKERMAK